MGSRGRRNVKYGYQDQVDLVQVDWEGNIVWCFDKKNILKIPAKNLAGWLVSIMTTKREGNPVGYYVPGMDPKVDSGNTLILCHENLYKS